MNLWLGRWFWGHFWFRLGFRRGDDFETFNSIAQVLDDDALLNPLLVGGQNVLHPQRGDDLQIRQRYVANFHRHATIDGDAPLYFTQII